MDRYAVIGNPVSHSKSPQIHAEFARQTGDSLTYFALLAPIDGFVTTVAEFIQANGKGLNVTVPFKLEAFDLSHRLSERAKAAGAVNTLAFADGNIAGDNTDGVGLVRDIVSNLRFEIKNRRVLLLGAGGAARGVMLPLLGEKPASITIANRTATRAVELVDRFLSYGVVNASTFDELTDTGFDLVINATAASLGNDALPISADIFSAGSLAYDMMYGKDEMPFLKLAQHAGAMASDGLGMLVEQAAESFFIWRGVRPDTSSVLEQFRAL